jgi:hypothetical protein
MGRRGGEGGNEELKCAEAAASGGIVCEKELDGGVGF